MPAVDLHFRDEGLREAPVVLMLGSLGSTLEMWDDQVPVLAQRFRVVRADARGHGRSPVPAGPYTLDDLVDDAVALLDRLGVARAHVVGLSLGGMTAMRLAARHPERVDRLALLCTSALLGPGSAWAERAAAVRSGGTVAIASTVVTRWFTEAGRAADPTRTARFEQMIAATPSQGYAACCDLIAVIDVRADLARITAPTLAIAGAEDPATPPAHLEAIAAGVRGARLLVVPGAAHLANIEQAPAVTAALLMHLDPAGSGPDDRGRLEQGLRVRREVLGDAHVDRAVMGATPFTAPFQDFINRTAWGDVWSRPGLTRRERSMLSLSALTSLGHEAELAMHVRGALTNGLSPADIAEVLLHTAIYAGVPAANKAFSVAARVIAEVEGAGGQNGSG